MEMDEKFRMMVVKRTGITEARKGVRDINLPVFWNEKSFGGNKLLRLRSNYSSRSKLNSRRIMPINHEKARIKLQSFIGSEKWKLKQNKSFVLSSNNNPKKILGNLGLTQNLPNIRRNQSIIKIPNCKPKRQRSYREDKFLTNKYTKSCNETRGSNSNALLMRNLPLTTKNIEQRQKIIRVATSKGRRRIRNKSAKSRQILNKENLRKNYQSQVDHSNKIQKIRNSIEINKKWVEFTNYISIKWKISKAIANFQKLKMAVHKIEELYLKRKGSIELKFRNKIYFKLQTMKKIEDFLDKDINEDDTNYAADYINNAMKRIEDKVQYDKVKQETKKKNLQATQNLKVMKLYEIAEASIIFEESNAFTSK